MGKQAFEDDTTVSDSTVGHLKSAREIAKERYGIRDSIELPNDLEQVMRGRVEGWRKKLLDLGNRNP